MDVMCPLSFGWSDGKELGATGSPLVYRLWKSRGQCSHSCRHWVFLSATGWCQVPMQVAGGETQSAGVGVVPVREQQVTYFVYGSFVPEL